MGQRDKGRPQAELREVTCGSHGALLNASHVARQKLMEDVRQRHVQKHLEQGCPAQPPRPGGPGGADAASLSAW